jgi:hypothetical protein
VKASAPRPLPLHACPAHTRSTPASNSRNPGGSSSPTSLAPCTTLALSRLPAAAAPAASNPAPSPPLSPPLSSAGGPVTPCTPSGEAAAALAPSHDLRPFYLSDTLSGGWVL